MYTIQLNNLAFFAHHGLHDEEAVTGTNFEIDVSIQLNTEGKIKFLHQTIDYTRVYEEIQRHMKNPVALLETLAEQITDGIYQLDNRINLVSINIKKIHPPIKNFIGNVGVSFTKAF